MRKLCTKCAVLCGIASLLLNVSLLSSSLPVSTTSYFFESFTTRDSASSSESVVVAQTTNSTTTRSDPAALDTTRRIPQRAFPMYPYGTDWCSSLEQGFHRGPTHEGFLYIKEFKTGSSTLAGVSFRIARNIALQRYRNSTEPWCQIRAYHVRARKFIPLIRKRAFLWSVVREPVSRLVSKFWHFRVSRDHVDATLAEMQDYFRSQRVEVYDHHYYLKTLTLREINVHTQDQHELSTYIHNILQDYDFIGITERLDESLVVLQLLLGLDTGDILYLQAAKSSGTYEYFAAQQQCILIQHSNVSAEMKDWFHSTEFQDYIRGDVLLYQAAQASLNLTIERLGRERVDRALARFQWAQAYAQRKCASTTKFPCSSDGTRNVPDDCIRADNACGYKCLDQVQAELETLPEFQTLPRI